MFLFKNKIKIINSLVYVNVVYFVISALIVFGLLFVKYSFLNETNLLIPPPSKVAQVIDHDLKLENLRVVCNLIYDHLVDLINEFNLTFKDGIFFFIICICINLIFFLVNVILTIKLKKII